MSSPPSGSPNGEFQARLERMAEARAPIDAAKPVVSPIPDWKENIKYPAAMVGAFLVGMLAVFVARYVRFQMMGGSLAGEDPDITMLIDGAIGGACSFLLFAVLRFEGAAYKTAQTFGIFAMICVMHNFVHGAPGLFNKLFSEDWTNEVIAYTEPNSILFRGASFVLFEPENEVASKPTIRRAGKI